MGNSVVTCPGAAGDNVQKAASFGPPTAGFDMTLSGNVASTTTALWARVEADVDGDGAGDESQDACPQSPTLKTACPTPKLAAKVLSTTKSFSAVATTDIITAVVASGSAKLPAQGGKKAKTIAFTGKPVASAPGGLTTVKLAWPKALKNALAGLTRRRP